MGGDGGFFRFIIMCIHYIIYCCCVVDHLWFVYGVFITAILSESAAAPHTWARVRAQMERNNKTQ